MKNSKNIDNIYMYILNDNKMKNHGITLIALVVTIIALLILSGITINLILGNNGIIKQAQDAKEQIKLSELEQTLGLIYTNLSLKKVRGEIEEIIPENIIAELENKGYEILSKQIGKDAITGIKLDQTSISIEENKTATVKVTYIGAEDKIVYYAVIDEKYYQISFIENREPTIDREAKNPQGEAVEKVELEVIDDYDKDILKAIEKNEDSINITAGTKKGETTLKIKYGKLPVEECVVTVTKAPISLHSTVKANPKEYYGKDVTNYEVTVNGTKINKWKIFYADNENVFIITSDYLPISVALNCINKNEPDDENLALDTGTYPTHNEHNICYNFEEAPKVASSVDEVEKFSPLTEETGSKLWPESTESNYNTYDNGRIVSKLLNKSKWEEFANCTFADKRYKAIGSPTLNMLVASWNEKYTTKENKSNAIYCNNFNNYGYYFGINSVPENFPIDGKMAEMDGYGDKLYYPHFNDYYYGCWVATTTNDSLGIYVIYDFGEIGASDYYCEDGCIRPVVCISNTIKMTEDSNGITLYN